MVWPSVASLFGGPHNLSRSNRSCNCYKAYNPAIMTWAAIFAILLAFVGKLGAILATIPFQLWWNYAFIIWNYCNF